MFYVIDNFFVGNITDAALINSLSALELGKQYVAVTQKGCDSVRIEKEISISYLEKLFMKEISEANREKGTSLAYDICKNYRREGLFFDEILDRAGGKYLLEEIVEADKDKICNNGEMYSKDVIYWIGYIYRYWHYYTGESSKVIYKQAPVETMKRNYSLLLRKDIERLQKGLLYFKRLQQAMEDNLLCPFHYFGITDLSIIGDEQEDECDFSMLTSEERVKHIINQATYYGYSGEKVKGLIFCSGIKETEVLSAKFNQIMNPETGRNYRTIALNGNASEEERQDAFERLAMNEADAIANKTPLDYIFSYEILNEGWEFLGGKIEEGETPESALKREIMEELDTEISVGELIETVEYDYPTFHLSMDCFWCEILKGDLVLKEHEAAKWLKSDELDTVEWLPADITLIESVKGILK